MDTIKIAGSMWSLGGVGLWSAGEKMARPATTVIGTTSTGAAGTVAGCSAYR